MAIFYFDVMDSLKHTWCLGTDESLYIGEEVARIKSMGIKSKDIVYYNEDCFRILTTEEYKYYNNRARLEARVKWGREKVKERANNLDEWLNYCLSDNDYLNAEDSFVKEFGCMQCDATEEQRWCFPSIYLYSEYKKSLDFYKGELISKSFKQIPLLIAEQKIKSYLSNSNCLNEYIEEKTLENSVIDILSDISNTLKEISYILRGNN